MNNNIISMEQWHNEFGRTMRNISDLVDEFAVRMSAIMEARTDILTNGEKHYLFKGIDFLKCASESFNNVSVSAFFSKHDGVSRKVVNNHE